MTHSIWTRRRYSGNQWNMVVVNGRTHHSKEDATKMAQHFNNMWLAKEYEVKEEQ